MTTLSQKDRAEAFHNMLFEAEKLGYCITDWVSVEMLMKDYDLTEEQAFEVIPVIDIGDYDEKCISANAGSMDGRRKVLDEAVRLCGFLEDLCSECGEELDLDGYDGKCGNCADIEANGEEEDDRDIDPETGDYRNWKTREEQTVPEKTYYSPRRIDPNNECPFVNIRDPNPLNDRDYADKDAQIAALKALVLEAGTLLSKVRKEYGSLHDDINDLIGEGEGDARLTEDMIPDDYAALVHRLVGCVSVDFCIQNFLEEVIETRSR